MNLLDQLWLNLPCLKRLYMNLPCQIWSTQNELFRPTLAEIANELFRPTLAEIANELFRPTLAEIANELFRPTLIRVSNRGRRDILDQKHPCIIDLDQIWLKQ